MKHFRFNCAALVIILWVALGTQIHASGAALSDRIDVTDGFGNRVILDHSPQKVACLYAFSGHVVTMLGRGRDMAAIVNGLKKDVMLRQLVPGIKKIPVPAKGGIINIEALLNTGCDFVFLKPETAKIQAEIKKLERFSLPYYVAGYNSMAGQMKTIESMGKILGCFEKARAYTGYYRDTIERVRNRTRQIPQRERVRLYHSVNEPTRTDGPNTIEADWTSVCGVINVSVGESLKEKDNKHFAGMEQILLWNPEVIIVNQEGVDEMIRTHDKWSAIQAVKDNRVYGIPVGISRWGHPGGLETPLAILWTAKTVYPGLFQDLDLRSEIKTFYHRYFDLTLDNAMVDKILANQGMRLRK
ncbi:MAG: iron ABC transporter substrate-binding protein [Desulfobacteraceae bacterium]|nr:MAG: iron ABC transporter substrate-binding protein [Desulfobacteraceae bacterium]